MMETFGMATIEPDGQALRRALEHASERAAGLVRDCAPLDGPVPGLDWTRAELTAHLWAVCEAIASTLRGEGFAAQFGVDFIGTFGAGSTLPESVAVTNAKVVKLASFPSAAAAADALSSAATGLLAAAGAVRDMSERRPAPWYGPNITMPIGSLLSLAASELLVHGHDLARAVGTGARPSAATSAAATAVAATVMSEMLPRLLDERTASGFAGSFEIRVRGGGRFVLRIVDGSASSEAAGSHNVDCVLSLSAYPALLIGFNRVPVWRVIASGHARAFGRRPWLGLRFHRLFLSA
jgi:Mycothiol maleylpyruvate isomerase N-terminal domain